MAPGSNKTPRKDEFTVGWICALAIELTASKGMLDEIYPTLDQAQGDENVYTLGRIGQHNIVIACLPAGSTGTTPAAKGAADMLRSFPRIRFGLMVGIGGGAPSANKPPNEDIRLGDVVVGVPDKNLGGVVKYDRGKVVAGGQFEHTGILNTPPAQLRSGVNKLRASHEAQRNALSKYVAEMIEKTMALKEGNPQFEDLYGHQGWEYDHLHEVAYEHKESAQRTRYPTAQTLIPVMAICLFASGAIALNYSGSFALSSIIFAAALLKYFHAFSNKDQTASGLDQSDPKQPCQNCDKSRLVRRQPRITTDPVIHYGTIASADIVMRHAATRDRLRRNYHILCFEMEAAGLMNDFPCLVILGICDYSDTHKHKLWQRYAAATAAAYAKELLGVIPPAEVIKMEAAAELVKTVREEIAGVHVKLNPLLDEQENKRRHDILSWLAPSTHQLEQSDAFNKHQSGTGQWFLDSKQFARWLNEERQTLFCPGIPGAGKTILASVVIDYLQRQRGRESSIVYLYCSYNKMQAQTTYGQLSIVLRQFVEQQSGSIPESVLSLYDSHKAQGSRPTLEEISSTLFKTVRHLDRAFLVVDALDECSEETCKELLDEVRKLQMSTRLNFMATSRPSLEQVFDGAMRLDIRAQESDIKCYLDDRLRGLSRCVQQDDELKQMIKQEIINTVDGMFLLATLHLDSLKDKRTKKEFRQALKALPKGSGALKEAYDNAMARINQQRANGREWAQHILLWIVHAVRPLRPDELRHALAIEEGDRRLEEDNSPVLDEILSLCAGLVILNQESDTVQLVHYTTHDYFSHLDWVHAARERVATGCITYLLFETFESGSCPSYEELQKRIELNPLYNYATANWGHHVRTSCIEEKELVLEFLEKEKYVSACGQALVASRVGWHDTSKLPRELTGMHLAAYFGLGKAIIVLLARHHNKDSVDSYGQTPLCWAVHGGQEAMAELLIHRGADQDLGMGSIAQAWPTMQGGIAFGSSTPLGWAARIGNSAMVKTLLENRVNPDLNPGTPLFWAAWDGNTEIVKLLLEGNASPDLAPPDGGSPLWFAARDGHLEIVNLLVKHDANPDLAPPDGGSPLWWAVRDGHLEIVNLLVKHDANPDLAPPDGGSPLWWAVRDGHLKIVNLLVKHDANPDLAPPGGGSPLWWAARDGHLEIVNLLLEGDADPFLDPENFQTPFLLREMGIRIWRKVTDRNGTVVGYRCN